jgi:hypothetical protein
MDREKGGTKEMLKMPSLNIFLSRSKGRNAIKKASLAAVVPIIMAMNASRITPNIRLKSVKPLIAAVCLIRAMTNLSLTGKQNFCRYLVLKYLIF